MATVLTFKEWQVFMVENTPLKTIVECPACEGSGVDYEECFHCGHEREDPCYACDQNGEILFKKLSKKGRLEFFTPAKYTEQVSSDLKKLAEWTGEDYAKLLKANGYDLVTVKNKWKGMVEEKITPVKKVA
jgi:hypothetical protein